MSNTKKTVKRVSYIVFEDIAQEAGLTVEQLTEAAKWNLINYLLKDDGSTNEKNLNKIINNLCSEG